MLNKMGWVTYSSMRGIGHGPQVFSDDPLVRYFIDIKSFKMCYIIKELSDEEKQKSKNLYKFIKMDYNEENPKFHITEFKTNHKLLSLVVENESCNINYQRNIKLSKILK